MNNITTYTINEIIALVMSVLIGSGAYIGFVGLKKRQSLSFKFIFLVLLINLFVTYVASELLKVFKWGEYRAVGLPLVAFAGQYLMEWFDKRNSKIFDSMANKAGINLKEENDENNNLNQGGNS